MGLQIGFTYTSEYMGGGGAKLTASPPKKTLIVGTTYVIFMWAAGDPPPPPPLALPLEAKAKIRHSSQWKAKYSYLMHQLFFQLSKQKSKEIRQTA